MADEPVAEQSDQEQAHGGVVSSAVSLADPPDSEEEEAYGGPVKSFLDHLEDLRWVLIKAGIALALGMIICMAGGNILIGFLKAPLVSSGIQNDVSIHVLSPIGGFMVLLQLTFWGGMAIAFPAIIYFVGDFVIPALKPTEKKYIFVAFLIGAGLFVAGACLGFFFILPASLKAFLVFNEWLGLKSDMWRAEDYFPFVSKLILGVGFSFELPVVILTLVKLELVSHEMLSKARRYMIVGNLILAAFVTPQDPLSTVMMAAPLQILFEICIWISAYWDRQRKRVEALEAASGKGNTDDSAGSETKNS